MQFSIFQTSVEAEHFTISKRFYHTVYLKQDTETRHYPTRFIWFWLQPYAHA